MTTIKINKTAAIALAALAFATTAMLAGSTSAKPVHGLGVTISGSGNGTGNTVAASSRLSSKWRRHCRVGTCGEY